MRKLRKTLTAILFVLLTGALVWLVFQNHGYDKRESLPEPTFSPAPSQSVQPPGTPVQLPEDSPSPEPPPSEPPQVTLGETEDMGQEYLDAFVFYGDSNTNGLRLNELLPGGYDTNQVWTPLSGTLTLNRWNIDNIVYPETWTVMPVTEAMALKKPEYLLINLGMNGISFMDEEVFTLTYTEMVRAIHEANPDTKIILSSIYPVADGYLGDSITNEKIDAANRWICGIAEREGFRYLDVNPILKCEEGDLPESLNEGNGFHLTSEGYRMVLDFIRTHGYK